jgi:hypothetical protein
VSRPAEVSVSRLTFRVILRSPAIGALPVKDRDGARQRMPMVSGAVSGRGHGRFWLAAVQGRDIVAIAHQFGFGFGFVHGPEAMVSHPSPRASV